MHYRKATIEDIPELARIRKMQLHDEGPQPEETMDEELEAYFSEKMADGSLIQWVAEDDNQIIGTGAIIFMDFPPSFTNKSGKQGYIANMYTRDSRKVDPGGEAKKDYKIHSLCILPWAPGVREIWVPGRRSVDGTEIIKSSR